MSWGETSDVIEAPQGFSIVAPNPWDSKCSADFSGLHSWPAVWTKPSFSILFSFPKSASSSREEKLYFPAVIPFPTLIYHSRQNDCSIMKSLYLLKDREVWHAAVQGVLKNWIWLSDWRTAKHKYSYDSIVLLNLGCWQDEMLLCIIAREAQVNST